MNLLEIRSSDRKIKSISRSLSNDFVQAWQTAHASAQHLFRDVGSNPPAHPTELWTKGNYTPLEARMPKMPEAMAESDRLIEELLWASH
jgi:FMN-dependent NADH-azoreductase